MGWAAGRVFQHPAIAGHSTGLAFKLLDSFLPFKVERFRLPVDPSVFNEQPLLSVHGYVPSLSSNSVVFYTWTGILLDCQSS